MKRLIRSVYWIVFNKSYYNNVILEYVYDRFVAND